MEVIGLTPKLEKLHLRRHHGHTRADQLREVRKGYRRDRCERARSAENRSWTMRGVLKDGPPMVPVVGGLAQPNEKVTHQHVAAPHIEILLSSRLKWAAVPGRHRK
jgi:hypothetical protein